GQHLAPDRAVELAAARLQGKLEGPPLAGEVFAQLPGGHLQQRACLVAARAGTPGDADDGLVLLGEGNRPRRRVEGEAAARHARGVPASREAASLPGSVIGSEQTWPRQR